MNNIENNDINLEKILTEIQHKQKKFTDLIKKAHITAKNNNTYTLVITDVLGRSVYKGNFISRVQLPLDNWQTGFYYVQVVSEDGYKEVQKLIVQ